MNNEKILIVDDDLRIQELLTRYLKEQGFDTYAVSDGKQMDKWLKDSQPELIILDLMLPGEDGLSLIKKIKRTQQTPIIMLTAKGDEYDRIIGLEVGADDYMPKPFNPRELLARIRAVLRRGDLSTSLSNSANNLIEFGHYVIDIDARILKVDNQEVSLTHGEMELLIILVTNPNKILSRDQLMDHIQGLDHGPFDRSIDVRITRLRQKIEDAPAKPIFIRTVWGQGYRFTPSTDFKD